MTEVADQLYLSYVLRGFSNMNMLRHWERLLRVFPFSRLSKTGYTFRVNAVSGTEPALFEEAYPDPVDVDLVLKIAKEYTGSDCAAQLDAKWDLWQYADDWKLTPSRVTMMCFGTGYEDREGDDLRVDFGPDALFLPDPELPNNAFMAQSNIRSLLKFVHDTDEALTAAQRRLWTESGENFAQRLQEALAEL